MIFINGKMTSWEDSATNMVKAAQGVATPAGRNTVSSNTGGKLLLVGKDAYTEDEFLINAAKMLGLKVEKDKIEL